MKIEDIVVPGYERVARARDDESGLRAIIAVHDTALGPSAGGVRMWNYASEEEALEDVLRLAQGMSYKSAVAETGLGGGKSVIIGDGRTQKSEALFRAMGRFVGAFGGTYYAAEDVGMTVSDLEIVAQETRWVTGLPITSGGSGDSSRLTALGAYLGIKTCLESVFGTPELSGRTVAIQGIGSVGGRLASHLAEAGASLVVADIREEKAQAVATRYGARVVGADEILEIPCDVLAPCALGGVLNDATIPRLQARIIAGAANNQLATEAHGRTLFERGVLYAPDFVINAGGIINIGVEFREGGYDAAVAAAKVESIPRALERIIATSKRRDISTSDAALMLAKERLGR